LKAMPLFSALQFWNVIGYLPDKTTSNVLVKMVG